MSTLAVETRASVLAERLSRGVDLLFDLEQRGDTDAEYQRWLGHWLDLLDEYEALDSAEQRAA